MRTTPGQVPGFDRKELEGKLGRAARRWTDLHATRSSRARAKLRGLDLYKHWNAAFPPEYRESVGARAAVMDVRKIDTLDAEAPLAFALYRPLGAASNALGFKVYRLGAPIDLSESLPMLEHMGVRVIGEQSHVIESDAGSVSLHDFELQAQVADEIEPETLARLFEDSFARVFKGEVENDDFNRLVLRASLAADEIVILRA